ncbi:MAG: hypothetical protein ACLUN0_04080 [Roseburia sp.]
MQSLICRKSFPDATFDRKYEGIAKYPAVSRDLSMVVPKHVLAGDIEKVFDEQRRQDS